MKRGRKVLYLSIVTALVLLASTPQLSSAALVWSEDFVELGPKWTTNNCGIVDECLHGITEGAVSAYCSSNISVGTWMLELKEIGDWVTVGGTWGDYTRVYFLSPDVPTYAESYMALSLKHASNAEGSYFTYRIEKYFDSVVTFLDQYSGPPEETTIGILHQFAITRTSDGSISVYLNGTQILQAVDTDITTTEYFGFYTRIDWALDNIEVFDSIEMGGGLPLVLVAVGVGVTVVVIAVVLLIRRR